MRQKRQFTDERAVSPVIAVVLMIAVTVILAAIVAAFALGMGGAGDATPQASFDYDYNGSTSLTITHEGGDTLTAAQVTVLVGGADAGATWSSTPIATGSSTTVAVAAGDEIRIRWESDSGKTVTLSTYTVPS